MASCGSIHVPTLVIHRRGDVPGRPRGRAATSRAISTAPACRAARPRPPDLGRRHRRRRRRDRGVPHWRARAPTDHRVLATVLDDRDHWSAARGGAVAALVAEHVARFGGRPGEPGIALLMGRAGRCAARWRSATRPARAGSRSRRGPTRARWRGAAMRPAGTRCTSRPASPRRRERRRAGVGMVRDLATDGELVSRRTRGVRAGRLSEPIRLLAASLRDDPGERTAAPGAPISPRSAHASGRSWAAGARHDQSRDRDGTGAQRSHGQAPRRQHPAQARPAHPLSGRRPCRRPTLSMAPTGHAGMARPGDAAASREPMSF